MPRDLVTGDYVNVLSAIVHMHPQHVQKGDQAAMWVERLWEGVTSHPQHQLLHQRGPSPIKVPVLEQWLTDI